MLIETDRLILRPFELDDIPAYAAIRAKPEVIRFLAGGVGRAGQAAEVADRVVRQFAEAGVPWAVIEKQSGRLIGHLGLRPVAELGGRTELLYLLDSIAWSRGYATEGAKAACDYGFKVMELDLIIAVAVPENQASLNVMAKIGMIRLPEPVEAFGLTLTCCELRRPIA